MQDCVFVKKKPARGYDFESIPRARRRNATTHPSFATRNPPSLAREGERAKKRNYSSTAKDGNEVSTSEFCAQNSADAVLVSKDKQKMRLLNAKLKGVKLCARGGRVYCDGVTFEGDNALLAAFEHIGILAFLRCGKVLSCK